MVAWLRLLRSGRGRSRNGCLLLHSRRTGLRRRSGIGRNIMLWRRHVGASLDVRTCHRDLLLRRYVRWRNGTLHRLGLSLNRRRGIMRHFLPRSNDSRFGNARNLRTNTRTCRGRIIHRSIINGPSGIPPGKLRSAIHLRSTGTIDRRARNDPRRAGLIRNRSDIALRFCCGGEITRSRSRILWNDLWPDGLRSRT